MSSVTGEKRNSLIISGKTGHKVLLFGEKVHGGIEINDHKNATVQQHPFPSNYESLERVANYSLVILDYSAFQHRGYDLTEQQKFFEKQMLDALDAGTTFCFVHYNQPSPNYNHREDDLRSQIQQLSKTQIGFKWLAPLSGKAYNLDDLIPDSDVQRNEFKPFLDRWGASHNFFESSDDTEFDDVISTVGELVSAFVINRRRGKLIYIPFQRDFARKEHTAEGLNSLIDCLLTYTTKSMSEAPAWGNAPFFNEEVELNNRIEELEKQVESLQAEIESFHVAKGLLFQSEYSLESSIPRFMNAYLGLQTFRDEKHKEDFWILDEDGEKAVIAEVKSFVKGFKRSAIFSLFNHREENKLDESFPALLLVNCNLQAGSFKDKGQIINKQDYEMAAQNNVLIIRVEDLLRIWDSVRNEKLNLQSVFNLLITSGGWLRVGANLAVKEMK